MGGKAKNLIEPKGNFVPLHLMLDIPKRRGKNRRDSTERLGKVKSRDFSFQTKSLRPRKRQTKSHKGGEMSNAMKRFMTRHYQI